MQKWVSRLIVLSTTTLFFTSSISYAQPFGAAKPFAATTTKVMSSDDFKSMVNTLGQQNQNSLSQQLGQQISKQPPLQSSTPIPPPSDTTGTMTTSAPTPPPANQIGTPPASPGTAQTTSTSPASVPTTQTTVPVRPQAPIYTGFGSGNNAPNAPANSSSGNNSDGFKINY